MIGMWAGNLIELKRLEIRLNELNQNKALLMTGIRPLPAQEVTTSAGEISGMLKNTPPFDLILAELSLIVPDEVWLSLIDIKRSDMSIKGFSKTQVAVAQLISRLEESMYFSDVEIVFSQKAQENVTFELRTRIRWT